MRDWIPTSERLPEDGQEVIIFDANSHCPGHYIDVATFHKGITEEEREQMKAGLLLDPDVPGYSHPGYKTSTVKRSRLYRHGDVYGNNLVPYCWTNGPMSWFGQDITHWMPLPELPSPYIN